MRKRILSAVLAGALSVSMIAGSALTASAADKRDANGQYAPDASTQTRRVYFAMPGCWESNYWKTEGKEAAGAYWWTGEDTIPWLGYKMAKDTSEANITNVYTTLLPCGGDNANQIIFNNFVDGLMPSMKGYTKERFDAAMQTVDAINNYHNIAGSDYFDKQLWMYVFDKLAEYTKSPAIEWEDPTNPKQTKKEKDQTNKIIGKVLAEYEDADDQDEYQANFDDGLAKLFAADFGSEKYSRNFFFDFENQSGMALGFGDMMYVCNLDPYAMRVSYTIVPEGKITYGGEYFFYYGNGEYGTWPTKELLKEKTGIEFVDGKVVAPESVKVDAYGNAVKTLQDADGNNITYMIAGTINGEYLNNKTIPAIPEDKKGGETAPTTDPKGTVPAPGKDAQSSTNDTPNTANNSNNTTNNSANGSVATGDFSFAVVAFVVVLAGLGVFYFTRKKYSK